MTAVRAAAVVLADVEAAVRPVQGQVAAAKALPRVPWIRVWKKQDVVLFFFFFFFFFFVAKYRAIQKVSNVHFQRWG